MKKLLIVLLVFLLVGCNNGQAKPEEKDLKIICPKGAPALSLLLVEENINFVDGTDALSAALLNPNPEYDVVIAPLNLGAKIISESDSPYRLYGIVTWGNLYYVENPNADNEEIALFGEGAVPQKIVDSVLTLPEQQVTYYPNVSEAQAALLSGKVRYALLAEPAYTATLAKATENNMELHLVYDLQEEWAKVKGVDNYPQAAIFVLEDSYQNNSLAFEQLTASLLQLNDFSSNQMLIEEKLEGNSETYGVPATPIVIKAWENLNLMFVEAKDCEAEISAFLELFNILNISDFFIK